MEPPADILGYPPAVEEGHVEAVAATGQEGVWVVREGSGVGVREQLQRSVPCRAGCVDEVVGGAPDSDGEEDEGGLGADEPGRIRFVGEVGLVEAGAVDGEVGNARQLQSMARPGNPERKCNADAVDAGRAEGGSLQTSGTLIATCYATFPPSDGHIAEGSDHPGRSALRPNPWSPPPHSVVLAGHPLHVRRRASHLLPFSEFPGRSTRPPTTPSTPPSQQRRLPS
jgi:hypothetical protein